MTTDGRIDQRIESSLQFRVVLPKGACAPASGRRMRPRVLGGASRRCERRPDDSADHTSSLSLVGRQTSPAVRGRPKVPY